MQLASAVLRTIGLTLLCVALTACAAEGTEPQPATVSDAPAPRPTAKLPPGIGRLLDQALADQRASTHTALFPDDRQTLAALECADADWLEKAQARRRKVLASLRQIARAGAELFDADLAGAPRRYPAGERIQGCTVKHPFAVQHVDLLFVGEQPGGRYRETKQLTCVQFDGDERWYLMSI